MKAFKLFSFPLMVLFSLSVLFFTGCENDNNDKTLVEVIRHFDKCGIKTEVIQPSFAKAIKASDGCQLTINGMNIEIYKYDVRDETQRKFLEDIYKNGYIDILTMKFEARANGSFVLIHGNEHPDAAKIFEAFDSF